MGLQIRVNVNPVSADALRLGLRQGLAEGGRLMLAASDALAPTEPDPRHGEHMTATGYTRVIPGVDDDAVEVGYRAFWAVWQDQDLTYNHPHGGEAMFLEKGMIAAVDAAMQAAADGVRSALGA